MKILVTIVNYGEEQLKYLDIIVKEYKLMSYDIDIVIHVNEIYNHFKISELYNDIYFKEFKLNQIIKLDDTKSWIMDSYEKLPWTTRQTLYDNRNDYDFFIFTENDHLITEQHIESYLKITEILPENRIAGHIQYEQYDKKRFYPAYHAHYHWDYESVEIYGDYIFAHFTNVHQACYMLTKKQHNKVIKMLNDYRLDLIRSGPYNVKPRVNSTIFTSCGMKKIIPISHFNDFSIHHLPNVYCKIDSGRLFGQGSWDSKMNKDIEKLINNRDKI